MSNSKTTLPGMERLSTVGGPRCEDCEGTGWRYVKVPFDEAMREAIHRYRLDPTRKRED